MDCDGFRLSGRGKVFWYGGRVKYFAHRCDDFEKDSGCRNWLSDDDYCDIHVEAWVRLPVELPRECWDHGRWVPGLVVVCGCACPDDGCGLSTSQDSEGKPFRKYSDLPFLPTRSYYLDAEYWIWKHGNCLMYEWEAPHVYQAVLTRVYSARPFRGRRGRGPRPPEGVL